MVPRLIMTWGGKAVNTTGRQSWCSGFGICPWIMHTLFTRHCTNNTRPIANFCQWSSAWRIWHLISCRQGNQCGSGRRGILKHCLPFTNSWMEWKEDSEQHKTYATAASDNACTVNITLGRVEEEAEESTLAHSYARVEQQAREVLLGGLPKSNCKRRSKATTWLQFIHSLQTMQCGTR